jgi:hypothetical protein
MSFPLLSEVYCGPFKFIGPAPQARAAPADSRSTASGSEPSGGLSGVAAPVFEKLAVDVVQPLCGGFHCNLGCKCGERRGQPMLESLQASKCYPAA